MEHNGYVTTFDTVKKYPILVEWWDTKERCGCNQIPRKDQFAPDPDLIKQTNIQKSYDAAPHESVQNNKNFWRGCVDGDGGDYCKDMIKYKTHQLFENTNLYLHKLFCLGSHNK